MAVLPNTLPNVLFGTLLLEVEKLKGADVVPCGVVLITIGFVLKMDD